MKTISIIVPCFNEEESVNFFYKEIMKVLNNMSLKYKIIFVDDGSLDNTLKEIKKLTKDKGVAYISFSRNFGKEAAMYAGLERSNSDYAVIIDADLQHNPNIIPLMYDFIIKDNCDLVLTRRIDGEAESKIRKICSKIFCKIMNRFSHMSFPAGIQDYCMMNRQVVNAIIRMAEYNRFSKGIFCWVGFNKKVIEVKNKKRIAGHSSWKISNLFKYAMEGITSFTTVPLMFATMTGLLTAIVSIIYIIYLFLKAIILKEMIGGYPVLIILILFFSSIQLISLGIIGTYLSKTYLETKKRPLYIIKEETDARYI